MPDETTGATRTLNDWNVQLLRLTVFPVEGFEAQQVGWWQKIVGQPPESQQLRPRQQVFVEVGDFEGGKLANSVAGNRVDWVYSALEREERQQPPEPFAVLGRLPDALASFVQAMKKWFEFSPDARRLALGAKVYLPVEGREEGNFVLSRYVPSLRIDDPKENTDLMYRINRRRPSRTLSGAKLNRLCTWSIVESVIAEMSPQSASGAPFSVRQLGKRAVACQVELDVSTDQFYKGTIESAQMSDVLDELTAAATELVERGDVS